MIQVPPGFDLSGFASDLFALGALLVTVSGLLTAFYLIKKASNQI